MNRAYQQETIQKQVPTVRLEYSNKYGFDTPCFPNIPIGSLLFNQSKQKKIAYFIERNKQE